MKSKYLEKNQCLLNKIRKTKIDESIFFLKMNKNLKLEINMS